MKTLLKIISLSMIVLFISCLDNNEETWVKTEFPQDTDISLLDIWSYTVPLEVESNGDWKIETKGDWFYVFPTNGKGNATVQICVMENDTEERQTGTITLLTANSVIQNLEIGQKSVLDYGLTNNQYDGTIRNYAVGYGYDTRGEYASPNGVTRQIVQTERMHKEHMMQLNSSSADFYEKTITGSSLEELSQTLSANVNFKGKFGGFRGEMKTAFKDATTDKGFNEYAISYIEYKVTDIIINTDIEDIKEKWLTNAAKKAINGDSIYKGTEGVKTLFREYGTHLITRADLGGRLKYNLSIDVSKVTGYYDITMYLKASYSNAFSSSDASLDDEIKKSYEDNKSSITLSFSVIGGNTSLLTDKSDRDAVYNWTKSVENGYRDPETNKTALIGFGDNLSGLVPIYELAKDPVRREEIKAVMEGDGYVEVKYEDKNSYRIKVPDFDNDMSATLVKEIKDSNRRVIAIVCNEFIPEINPTRRMNVVYPVASGKILMHAGFFTGYQGRRPARISWNGSNLKIVDYEELQENTYADLYISGASIKTESNNNYKQTSSHNAYLSAVNYFYPSNYNYPLVKIFGDIWTREDYKSEKSGSGAPYKIFLLKNDIKEIALPHGYLVCNYASNIMYNSRFIDEKDFAPSGWEVPTSTHYKEIHAMLTKYNLHTGQSLRHNPDRPQTLGYEAPTTSGWMKASAKGTSLQYLSNPTENMYWTQDAWYVSVNEAGFGLEAIKDSVDVAQNHYMPVRLIKKN